MATAKSPKSPKSEMQDPKMLRIADRASSINMATAYELWACALGGGAKVSQAQKNSVEKVLSEKKFDGEAKAWLQQKMDLCNQNSPGHLAPISSVGIDGNSQFKAIQGVNYERALLKKAVQVTAAGAALDIAAAYIIWNKVTTDGNKVTESAFRTVEFIIAFYPTSKDAHDYLDAKLKAHPSIKTRKFPGIHSIVARKKVEVAIKTNTTSEAVDEDDDVSMGVDSDDDDDDDDDDDGNFNFDTVAQQAVSAIGSSSTPGMSSRELREIGLDVGLGADQLYLTSSTPTRAAFDTAAPPGVCALDAGDFRVGGGAATPIAGASSREVRGAPVRPIYDKKLREAEGRQRREEKLSKWFNMPKRKMTPELEKELQVLKLRAAFDPKRFYKANDSKALPTHFVRATEVGGGRVSAGMNAAAEVRWNSGRTFLDSILRDQKSQEFTWKKHGEVNQRGHAAFNSGHGKAGKHGRKGLKSTKRGGQWKKNKKG